MKNNFKAELVLPQNNFWQEKTKCAKWLSENIIVASTTPEHNVRTYIHSDYIACEYSQKLNIFSFGKIKLNIPFTVVAPPVSVDEVGYLGNIDSLINDYKQRKSLFLLLNLKSDKIDISTKFAIGKTLPTCIFKNRFNNFDSYINTLRSSYRRRVKTALIKGELLNIISINNTEFTQELYNLYLQVLSKSDFPLEKLPINFFRNCNCKIDVFYLDAKPLAFVMYDKDTNHLNFIFGGMDYNKRDNFDLYYNMLLHLIKIGINEKVEQINFGQTAEATKCRIGCNIEDRYMIAFSGNTFLNNLLRIFAPFLQNNRKNIYYNAFKF